MKTLVVANQKGGVGKSAIACQLGYFLASQLQKRTLIIDLDHQKNTTKTIRTSQLATITSISSSRLFTEPITTLETGDFVLIPADDQLMTLEREKGEHSTYAERLNQFLVTLSPWFDVVVLDTNPSPDIRMISSLVVSDFVLSPIQLNQEAVDGIAAMWSKITKIKSKLNPQLHFLGILPNMVQATPFQRDNLTQLYERFAELFIRLNNGQVAAISLRTAVAEAQATGLPIWKSSKTSSRDAWAQIQPIFSTVAQTMGL